MNYEQADKILILGIDGMDPRITKKYLDKSMLSRYGKALVHRLIWLVLFVWGC